MSLGTIAVVTPPEDEPVTVAQMRDHCRIDSETDNTYLASLIVAARNYIENATEKLLAPQTVRQKHDRFPCGSQPIKIQRAPVTEIEIAYFDSDGEEQEIDDFQTNLDAPLPIVAPAPRTSWPATECGRIGAVTLTIEGGFDPCPDDLKQAIKMLAAHWYANREPVVTGTIVSAMPLTVQAIIEPYISPLMI